MKLTWIAIAVLGFGLPVFATPSQATTLGFEAAPLGEFSGPVTESGYTYTALPQQVGGPPGVAVNVYGDPGHDMEGYAPAGGGNLIVVSASASTFTYQGLDYAAYSDGGQGDQTLLVLGFRGGVEVGSATYTIANTNIYSPTYSNWTTEGPGALAGVTLDRLLIALNASAAGPYTFQAIDNLVLSGAAIPEPAGWALMVVGASLVGSALRGRARRRSSLASL